MQQHSKQLSDSTTSESRQGDRARAVRSFEPARSTTTRAIGAVGATLITLAIVQSMASSFLSVRDAQLAKAAIGSATLLAAAR